MKTIFLIPIFLLLVSCLGCQSPDYVAIKSSFESNKSIYYELMDMISSDTLIGECATISDHHIMDWWEYDGLWNTTQDYQNKIHLDEVLQKIGMEPSRYQNYLRLLEKIGAKEGISHCKELVAIDGSKVTTTEFILKASGLSVSGCMISIIHRGNQPIPEDENEPEYFYKRVPIDQDWYIEYTCT